MFHIHAWLVWLAAALLPFTLTKNPFYLLLALAALTLDYFFLCRDTPLGKSWSALLGLGITVALFSVLYNVLFVSVGATKLATLPALRFTFSEATIQIGGAVTLESLMFGWLNALSLIGILVAFATFNALADHYQLLRSAPRFLYQSAIVLSIAVTFVPQMVAAQSEIREAQLLRGHRFRALRDLLPLFVTLLAEGLEHSITLAESMSARGFGSPTMRAKQSASFLQGAIALGLFAVLCGMVAWTYLPEKIFGIALLIVGGCVLAGALWRIGSQVQVSRYRRVRWTRRDVLVLAASSALLLIWLGMWFVNSEPFIFYPYPRLKMPAFDPLLFLSLVLLTAPLLAQKIFPHD
jgi:energy-coupling factor transport system permease protein